MTESTYSAQSRGNARGRHYTRKTSEKDIPMLEEMKACFRFFYENFSRKEETYGLMPDRIPDVKNKCSIAANGFMLAAMAIGVDMEYVAREEAQAICIGALKTLFNLEQDHGFFYHFYDMNTGARHKRCELSTIDTALLLCGALTAGAYFKGEVLHLARKLAVRCDWKYFYDGDRKMFRMARYDNGFSAWWDSYAEQLIIYVLAAAGSDKDIAREAYYSFHRLTGANPCGEQFVHTWFGSLFAHQFSHAFVNFRGKKDLYGCDWFQNSVKATKNDKLFCKANSDLYPNGIWGLTSSAVPGGYKGHIGSAPSGNSNTEHLSDGTVAPCAALGSIVFTPQSTLSVLAKFCKEPRLFGQFGLYDSYNPVQGWVTDCYIAIDKGITLLMGANYYKRTVWRSFNSLAEIRRAMKVLGITRR